MELPPTAGGRPVTRNQLESHSSGVAFARSEPFAGPHPSFRLYSLDPQFLSTIPAPPCPASRYFLVSATAASANLTCQP